MKDDPSGKSARTRERWPLAIIGLWQDIMAGAVVSLETP